MTIPEAAQLVLQAGYYANKNEIFVLDMGEPVKILELAEKAAQLVLQAGYYANKNEIFVLDMGEPVKILELAEKMIHLAGYKPYDEIEIKEVGLRPGEKMFEELALEIEKCHRTANKLIFVHEPIEITQEEIDRKLDELYKTISETDDIAMSSYGQ